MKVSRQKLHEIEKGKWFGSTHYKTQKWKTNIGKVFLKLARKYFHKRHRCKKMFNTNTIKLSYSCNPNVTNLVKQHNNSVMKSDTNTNKKDCNCINKDNCSLDRKSLVERIVYEATVSIRNQTNTYFGLAEGDYKSRYIICICNNDTF